MICFPLDNTPYEAKDVGSYLATRTRGVFSADDNLQVTATGKGLSISVSSGLAWLKWSTFWGTSALEENALTFSLDPADGVLNRIDVVVCRLNKVENKGEIVIKKGALATTPIILDPVRNSAYDEIYLAAVEVSAGAVTITKADITDLRLNEKYCGIMRDGVNEIPTQSLYNQAQALIDSLKKELASVVDGSAYMLKTVYDTNNDGAVDSADKLQTARTINNVPFDGTEDITIKDSTAMPKSGGEFTGAVQISITQPWGGWDKLRGVNVFAKDSLGANPLSTRNIFMVRK